MRILKKINKGLVLTIIVLAVLIIYLTNVEKQRDADKPEIKKACEEFIALTDKYAVLPEDLQIIQEEIPEDKLEEYEEKMKSEIEKLMIQNEQAIKIQQKILGNNLRNGYNKLEARTSQTRKIKKINRYEFDGDQVTVIFNNQVNITVKTFNGIEEKNENKTFEAYYDEIILQKVDGNWKVVYSNLQFDDAAKYWNSEIMELY